MRHPAAQIGLAIAAVTAATLLLRASGTTNATTVALSYFLVVLFVAAAARLWVALTISAVAMLCFNFFFLPPVGTLTIADPHNWVALVAFVVVSAVASQLSASARTRTTEAEDRRKELTRLFDLTRDVLLTTDTDQRTAVTALAIHVTRRFELDVVVICLPDPRGGWRRFPPDVQVAGVTDAALDGAFAASRGVLEFDARRRAYGGQSADTLPTGKVRTMTPVRLGTRVTGLLAAIGRPLEPGALDAIAGIVAIAIERQEFLAERQASEVARHRAELSSALLASLSHDMRTPLTAIRTAVGNIAAPAVSEAQRQEQAQVALEQIARLTRLFDEILDMAKIESRTVRPEREWVTPAAIVEAAITYAGATLDHHALEIDAVSDVAVEADPHLTSSALAHLLENAAAYSPHGSAIEVRGWVDADGLLLTVRDHGSGLDPVELTHVFEPFFRGRHAAAVVPGTGMGLAITRGLLTVEGGRVWAENIESNGAQFSIRVPARSRPVEPVQDS